jgi:hypothetical protein
MEVSGKAVGGFFLLILLIIKPQPKTLLRLSKNNFNGDKRHNVLLKQIVREEKPLDPDVPLPHGKTSMQGETLRPGPHRSGPCKTEAVFSQVLLLATRYLYFLVCTAP